MEGTSEMIESCLASMDDDKRNLTRPMLEHYVWLVTQAEDLRDLIDREGAVIEIEKGGKDNRHTAIVENPAVGTLHKVASDVANYYAKLMRFLTKAELDKVDELEEFLKTR